jgi:hypothetical protein
LDQRPHFFPRAPRHARLLSNGVSRIFDWGFSFFAADWGDWPAAVQWRVSLNP